MNNEEFRNFYSQRTYLGDGLYVNFDGYHFILSTERYDQRDPKLDIIGLEPDVFNALIEYRKQVYKDAENLKEDNHENL